MILTGVFLTSLAAFVERLFAGAVDLIAAAAVVSAVVFAADVLFFGALLLRVYGLFPADFFGASFLTESAAALCLILLVFSFSFTI